LLAANDENHVAIAEAGSITAVVAALQQHPTHAEVQQNGCRALCNLALNAENTVAIAEAGGIAAIVAALQQHPTNADLQVYCWHLLQRSGQELLEALFIEPEDFLSELDGLKDRKNVHCIVEGMRIHCNHSGVQEQGCGILWNLTKASHQLAVTQAGGIAVLVEALKKHHENANVQAQGCGALQILALITENRVAIAQADGIVAVVAALQEHTLDAGVQVQGCTVLANLAYNAENKVSIAQAGGIKAIIDGMKQQNKHATVQETSCRALAYLVNNENNVAVAQAGGITVVVDAMKTHNMHANVQEWGCMALIKLARSAQNRVAIAQAGGIAVVVDGMKAHITHANVQGYGCGVLYYLADNAENKAAIVQAVGIEVIVEAIEKHSTHAKVQEQGCKALCMLADNAENKVAMVDAGVKKLVQKAMVAGNASAETQIWGQKLLDSWSRAKRWGDGLDSPVAGSRHFFPQGFVGTLDVAGAIASFGHCAAHVARIMDAGRIKASTASTPLHAVYGAALYAYTEETPLYGTLNYAMRTPDSPGTPTETELKCYADYIIHTSKALGCLQTYIGTVYRGIKLLLAPEIYSAGKPITWQAFSSSTKKQMATLEFVMTLPGRKLQGSIFVIESMTAKDIRHFSAIPSEEEVLFPPNSQFIVDKVLSNEQDKKRLLSQLSAYDMTDLDVYQLTET